MQTQVTMLNSMASPDFTEALDRHVEWGLKLLDLRDAIYGKKLIDLTIDEAENAAVEIANRDLQTHCLSSPLFVGTVEDGRAAFKQNHLAPLDHLLQIARIFRPKKIRLLAAETSRRSQIDNAVTYVREAHPWLFDLYSQAIERIDEAGFHTTIENELGGCIFSTPEEVRDFFSLLDTQKASFTWDVQNLWQMGTFPSGEAYEILRPFIGYIHLKGGKAEADQHESVWASSLEDASWPVDEILRRIVSDGISPVICLNSAHGKKPEGYDMRTVAQRDLAYVNRIIREVQE